MFAAVAATVQAGGMLAIVTVAAVAGTAAALLGDRGVLVPTVVVELLLGVLIGPQVLGLEVTDFTQFLSALGLGMLFEAFAAVVIGGVSLRGGIGGLSGVFAGVLLLSAIDTAINVMGIEPYYMQVIRGGLMLLAVLLDSVKTAIRQRYL